MLVTTGITSGALLAHPLSDKSGSDALIGRTTILDCDNGPKVKHVSVRQIVGGRGMRVEVEFEICRKICVPGFVDSVPDAPGGALRADAPVLSNRRALNESKDDNWTTARVLRETLRVAHSSFRPHATATCSTPAASGMTCRGDVTPVNYSSS